MNRFASCTIFFPMLLSVCLAGSFPARVSAEPPPVSSVRLPPRALSVYGWTPLHWLARTGTPESIRDHLAKEPGLEETDELQRTPLHLAVLAGEPEVARALLEAGADVNAPDQWGVTPLGRAELLQETRGWNLDAVIEVLAEFGEHPEQESAPIK